MHKKLVLKNQVIELDKNIFDLLSAEKVMLNSLHEASNQLEETYACIEEWNIQTISGDKINNRFFVQVQHIKFPSIKELNITDSNIYSLEGFHRIFWPSLQSLRLNKNHICHLGTFHKSNCPALKLMIIIDNLIGDCEVLTKLKGEEIEVISFEFYSNLQCFDLNWLVKLESSKLRRLYYTNPKRIKQKSFKNIIQRIYSEIYIKDDE